MTAVSPSENKLPGRGEIQRGESPSDSKLPGGGHKHETPIIKRRRRNGNAKPMRSGSLHHHSTFSYKDGYQLPEAHVRRAVELQMPFLAMTEHGNVSSHVKLEKACIGTGVKPIYGCEFYTGPVGEKAKQIKYHLTVLARNEAGYKNLMRLVSLSYAEGFYYEPTISMEMLRQHKDGLIILSGCQGSILFCSAVGGKDIPEEEASEKRAMEVARKFKKEFGEWYFIEVQSFPELDKCRQAAPILARIARKLGIKLCGTVDAHYCELEEAEVQMILHNIRGGGKESLEDQARRWGYDVPQCPPLNDMSFYRRLMATGLSKSEAIEAVVTTEEIAQSVTLKELPKLPMIKFPVPVGYKDVREFWRDKLKEGWRFRGFDRLKGAERDRARAQLKREMDIIEAKGFEDYLMIVRDAVVWCKDLDIPVGPARGSAAASLACFLLRITEVNPLRFPLLVFERFIDITREDLPDIDLDFPSEARPGLRDYLVSRYGNVYNIGTFTYFKGKLALDDVARVYKVPAFEVARIKDFLIERSSGDLRASATIEDTVAQFPQAAEVIERYPELRKSELLEGNAKSFGVHAAGLAISADPIEDAGVTAVIQREVKGHLIDVVSLDKKDAERQGLVKMDFLGLSTMSMIWDSIKYLNMKIEDLYELPLDDERVFKAFRENDVVGVFQFDGRAMRYVCGSMKPDNFSEICDCNALARPGPLHNGAASEYAEIKHGGRKPERLHPAVDVITAPTQYQIVYQEQILRIVREVGNFSWTHAATIRQIISRKEGEAAFNSWWERFREGAMTVHERYDVPPMSEETAKKVWGSMITSGSYAFNAAHCVAYGFLAYWTMWLKVHHPDVFYAFSLASTDNPERIRQLLRDASKHGIRIIPPSPTRSTARWQPVRKPSQRTRSYEPVLPVARMGLEQIKGIGAKQAQAILEYREGLSKLDGFGWSDLINIKGFGPKTVDRIREFAGDDDPFHAFKIDGDIAKVKEAIINQKLGTRLPYPTHAAQDLPFEQGREFAVVWLGTILARNIRDIFEVNRAKTGVELDAGKTKDPHLNEWAMLTCEDETDQLLLKIDRWKYPQFKHAIFDFRLGQDLLLVEGVRPRYVTSRQIKVKKLWVINPDD